MSIDKLIQSLLQNDQYKEEYLKIEQANEKCLFQYQLVERVIEKLPKEYIKTFLKSQRSYPESIKIEHIYALKELSSFYYYFLMGKILKFKLKKIQDSKYFGKYDDFIITDSLDSAYRDIKRIISSSSIYGKILVNNRILSLPVAQDMFLDISTRKIIVMAIAEINNEDQSDFLYSLIEGRTITDYEITTIQNNEVMIIKTFKKIIRYTILELCKCFSVEYLEQSSLDEIIEQSSLDDVEQRNDDDSSSTSTLTLTPITTLTLNPAIEDLINQKIATHAENTHTINMIKFYFIVINQFEKTNIVDDMTTFFVFLFTRDNEQVRSLFLKFPEKRHRIGRKRIVTYINTIICFFKKNENEISQNIYSKSKQNHIEKINNYINSLQQSTQLSTLGKNFDQEIIEGTMKFLSKLKINETFVIAGIINALPLLTSLRPEDKENLIQKIISKIESTAPIKSNTSWIDD